MTAPVTATALAPRIPVNALSVGTGVVLPRTLDPNIDNGFGDDNRRNGNPRFMRPTNGPMRARAGTPDPIVRSCQAALITAARAYGAVAVDAVSGGRATAAANGGFLAPINARVTYSSGRISQFQQAQFQQPQVGADPGSAGLDRLPARRRGPGRRLALNPAPEWVILKGTAGIAVKID